MAATSDKEAGGVGNGTGAQAGLAIYGQDKAEVARRHWLERHTRDEGEDPRLVSGGHPSASRASVPGLDPGGRGGAGLWCRALSRRIQPQS